MKRPVISNRNLSDKEISTLIKDIALFPDLIYVSYDIWRKQPVYVIESDGRMLGVVIVYVFGDWIKIGPLAILKKFHGKGYGKLLLKMVFEKYGNKNAFMSSTNPAVEKIALKYGFRREKNFMSLPGNVKLFLLRQLIHYLRIENATEAVRKNFFSRRNKRKYFMKYSP